MPQYLDGRTSQNASYNGSINIPTSEDYQLFGTLGLNVSEANPTAIIRVQFDGIITFSLSGSPGSFTNLLEIKIVRGTDPNLPPVFRGIKTLTANGAEGTPQEYSFTASDYNVPKGSGFLLYTAFVRNVTGFVEAEVMRIGPESFNASAIG
ncbi:hypothetical protein [Peribacillus frigoritolerans]|uniref:hypothetical protein n=1 Tax=Peribacillus frigoritolerans TaxID=450367 RepID=UPI0039A1F95E